ncbi:MAG: phosphate acyltransferase [candidate division Zixibacteria bacterium]|nr:phosphate acyltransferase [candidate division Zixibacteria bacterium]
MTSAMTIPEVHNFDHLIRRAKDKTSSKKPRAALVVPSAPEWLLAFDRAIDEKLVEPVVIGDKSLLKKNVVEYGVKLDGAEVIDINQPNMAVVTAARMAERGEIDLIIKGRGTAVSFIKQLLDRDSSFTVKGKLISHLAVIKPRQYDKLILLTDAGVVPQPDLKTKLALINNAVDLAGAFGIGVPRVAVLAAVETIYPQMQVTTEAAVLSKMADRGQIKNAFVDGPLSFDVAVDMVAAHSKGITTSEVAGQADVMIAPNIETANGVYKAMALYGNAQVGGILYGGCVPVALAEGWEPSETGFNSIVLAVLAAVR